MRSTTQTTTLFTESDYHALAAIVFRPDYPGNATARGVVEAPNGDGKLDTTKRYSHVATKYLDKFKDGWQRGVLLNYLHIAHNRACEVAAELGVPSAFMPSFEHGALRVLEYPAGASSEVHTDVGLLTLNLWRNLPECLETYNTELGGWVPSLAGPPPYHLGRIAREIGIGPAAPHRVMGAPVPQHSLVYFAVPDWKATLPSGANLGEWLQGEMAKMRYDATEVSK